FEATLHLLGSAKPLKNRAPVHFHSGTAEVPAEVRTLDNRPTIEPGASVLVRLVLREPLLLLPGDRFIIRMWAPVTTIGGGEIIDCNPPRRIRRDALLARAQRLAAGTLAERTAQLVGEAPDGLPFSAIVARTGAKLWTVSSDIQRFGDWLITTEALEAKWGSFRQIVAEFHKANPLLPGIGKEELRTRLMPAAPPPVFEAILAGARQLVVAGEHVRVAGHKLALQADEQEATKRIEEAFKAAGLNVPPLTEVLKTCGVDPARARTLLQILLRDKRLVRTSEDLVFHISALDGLKERLTDRKGQRFSVPDFKDWTGVSRKYAIPLLEWLDAQRITRRDGDTRIVL
ncbi:MAG TPA: SelB C-terminal domain-containing protein, partial [Bryobacteraceae bacterium]|nr:SelB C-terminal domain-containing protein [Bryobacteraceae bacterium]